MIILISANAAVVEINIGHGIFDRETCIAGYELLGIEVVRVAY